MSRERRPWRLALKKWVWLALSRLPRRLRDPLVLSRIHEDTDSLKGVVVKIAETQSEHEQASRLLHDAYVETDLVSQLGVPVRITPYLMLPGTVRFVAVVDGEVVATLSLVRDSKLGLPLDKVCGEAVQALRDRGESVAEIGALAVKPGHRKHGLTMLLYKAMWKTAAGLLGVKHLVVSVRREAGTIYEAALRFVPLVPASMRYPGINGDSCALRLDIEQAPREYRRAFAHQPESSFNPYAFFVEAFHPQLRLPKTAAELTKLQHTHQQAALRLAWLRPEVVTTLSPDEFRALENALAAG